MQAIDVLGNQLKAGVLEKIDLSRDMEDDEIKELILEQIQFISKDNYIPINKKDTLANQIFNSIRKLDILQPLVEDDSISEIMVNGPNDIFIERNGKVSKTDIYFSDIDKLEDIAQRIVSKVNRMVNESSPIVDARLEDGSRVNIVLPPIALNGPFITIRKFPNQPYSIDKLISIGAITIEAALLLEQLVRARYNIFISGGTGSGKTTFLNVLSNYVPGDERVITIEDSAELQIKQIENLVRLEARNANSEGKNEITIKGLIKAALRMRPDRIIVGEVRGAEAIDMLQAMNTGHDGSLSTGHANSPKDLLSRLEVMILQGIDIPLVAIQRQIVSAIDIIVHLARQKDKTRKISEICEVVKEIGDSGPVLNTLFKLEKDELIKCGELVNNEKLNKVGSNVG
ncbi:MAG: putative conjugal transfer protein [Clostridiales bacterium]|nr:putative conjugal transfer protein [Clostridiales bacterium]